MEAVAPMAVLGQSEVATPQKTVGYFAVGGA